MESLQRSESSRAFPVEEIIPDADEKRLNDLGYKQEYNRVISPLEQFAYTITYTAPLGFVTGYYGYMYCYGGPVAIFWGMVITSFSTLSMVLSIAEVYSMFPTLGSVYYWVAQLLPHGRMLWLSWFVGWIYLMGAFYGTALNEYLIAQNVQKMILLSTRDAHGSGLELSNFEVLLVTAGFFVIHLAISVMSSKSLGCLSSVGAWFQVAATLAVGVTLLSITPKFQSPRFVFTKVIKAPSQCIGSIGTVFALGFPYFQAILTGFDVGSHIVEEVKEAAIAGPLAMVRSVYVTATTDIILLLIMTFCIQNPDHLLDSNAPAGGGLASAGIQIFYDAFEARYRRGRLGAVIFTGLATGSLFFANVINVTLTARCTYAMARDSGLPFQTFLTKLTSQKKVPLNATIVTVVIAFAATLPSLGSTVAFTAIAAMSTVTALIPYTIVLICNHFPIKEKPRHAYGPFNLSGWGVYFGAWGGVWGVVITVLFCLPLTYPISLENFNYTAVSLIVTIILGLVYWMGHGKQTYKGPQRTMD